MGMIQKVMHLFFARRQDARMTREIMVERGRSALALSDDKESGAAISSQRCVFVVEEILLVMRVDDALFVGNEFCVGLYDGSPISVDDGGRRSRAAASQYSSGGTHGWQGTGIAGSPSGKIGPHSAYRLIGRVEMCAIE